MRKLVVVAGGIFGLLASMSASALLITDEKNPYVWLNEGESHTVVHDLTDDGVPETYVVDRAALKLGFSDGYFHGDWDWDIADISGDGIRGILEVDGTHAFGYDIRWVHVGSAGIDSLNTNGLLRVTVTAINDWYKYNDNDFWWKTSKLYAKVSEVPEPGTLALLGAGLLGLGLARRRRQS